jgi:hypothetical protein
VPLSYADALIQWVRAGNGIDYAYRDLGDGDVPLVLLQHFRGNLDNWDAAPIDALAAHLRLLRPDGHQSRSGPVGRGAHLRRTDNGPGRTDHMAVRSRRARLPREFD